MSNEEEYWLEKQRKLCAPKPRLLHETEDAAWYEDENGMAYLISKKRGKHVLPIIYKRTKDNK